MTPKTLLRSTILSLAVLLTSGVSALAETGLHITEAYARVSSPNAKAGAAFMVIQNTTEAADRLIGVQSDVAARVELHTHVDAGDGVMQMRHVEDGFVIPAGGTHVLDRGGDHVMFMGLTRSLNHGDTVSVTFTFETAGEVTVDLPVDLER